MGQIKNIKLHIVTDIKRCSWFPRKSLAMLSLQILRICPRSSAWTSQCDKLFVAPFTTSSMILGKSKFHLPMRDYMLESERIRNEIDAKKRRNFYNKLHLEITNRHTKAFVENINGQIICYASTTEMGIAKRLHSVTDVCAVVNIARILAERLKKVGLERVQYNVRYPRTTEKVREFEGMLRNNGIILAELPRKILLGRPATLPPKREKPVLKTLKLGKAVKNKGTKPKKRQKRRF